LSSEWTWNIIVFPTSLEIVAGAVDDEVVTPGFDLDLELLQNTFERVNYFAWDLLGVGEVIGPCVAVEGAYHGHHVVVQVVAYPPDDEEPTMKIDMTRLPP